jgi:hypothetical protein
MSFDPLTLSHSVLLDSAVAPSTLRTYTKNLEQFLTHTRRTLKQLLRMRSREVDYRLSEYIDHLYATHHPFESASHALNGLVYRLPHLKQKLGHARLRLRGWRRTKHSTSHPPLTWELTVLLAITMAQAGHHGEAVACLVAFDCYLRVGELTRLTIDDVVRRNDARMGNSFTGMALRLAKTKTGLNQWVSVKDPDVENIFARWLRMRCAGHGARFDPARELVFPFSPAHFRQLMRRACDSLGVGETPYVPHSFRHGGATADFLRRRPIEDIMNRGRWRSMESARRYIQTGRALLAAQRVPAELNQDGALFAQHLPFVMKHLMATVPLKPTRTPAGAAGRRVTFRHL